MQMTGLQIFKYLPASKKLEQSNCKKCGCPTCMAFALKLAKQQIEIEKCPCISDDFKEIYAQSVKHAQKTVLIKDLKVGGENVLYRHEKTFINPTILAVIVDCSKYGYKDKIKRINSFGLNILNNVYGVDLIILKNADIQGDKFISYENFKNSGIDIINEKDFQSTKAYLITKRIKAIKDKDDDCSDPVCVIMNNDEIQAQCVRASYYLCKYANMIVFEEFNEEMFSSLITLRNNIFTDPQKTLQVESGLYMFNEPDENSIIFLTTNFALTFFAVSNELQSLKVPSYLIVIPAQGMSVLTAWSAETFNSQIVAKTINDLGIKSKMKTRRIIIPGLLADMIEELKNACPDFDFIKGTKEASEIADFVSSL